MKKIVLIALTLLFTLHLYPQKLDKERELTNTDKILGLSRLWEGVRNNFVYYDQLKFNWDSLYAASLPTVLSTKDTYSYIKELERIVAMANDGHTLIMHNVDPDWKDRITPAPFTTKLIEGKVVVDQVWSSELIEKGVKRGVLVTAIDGLDAITYGKQKIGQYISSSTEQWLEYKIFNDFALTKGKRTLPVNVEFHDGKKNFSVNINRDIAWDIQEKDRKTNKSQTNDFLTFKYTTLSNNIGLLKINDFMNVSFNQLFDSIYSKILQSDALIIDLRNNKGGNSDKSDYVLTHLSNKMIKKSTWGSRMYIPAHASWGYPNEWYYNTGELLSPVQNKPTYEKPIIVLINEGTFSSAEDFCAVFKGMKRGKLIGSKTGGSTGNGIRITLIDNLVVANICTKKDISPDGTSFVGVGIIPDIEIKESMKSFLENKDVALERALLEIEKKN